MKTTMSSSYILAAICLLATISTVRSQCCDFEATSCSWSTAQWRTAPSARPITTNYPEFDLSKPSDTYIFVQDSSATDSSYTTFHIASPGVVFSFDYFMDSYDTYAINNKLEVFFESGGFTFILAMVMVQSSRWQHVDVQCSSSNSFCCPNGITPCDGTIKISAVIDVANPVGLFAVDNIGLNSSSTTSTALPTTCCDFQENDCGATGPNWYWSSTTPPPPSPAIPPPPTPGDYFWSDVPQTLTFVESDEVPDGCDIGLEYYINSFSTTLQITFYPSIGIPVPIRTLTKLKTDWEKITLPCTGCCLSGGTCKGMFTITGNDIGTNYAVAIDNFDIDNKCTSRPDCCFFNGGDFCGYDTNGGLWISSTTPPTTTTTMPVLGSDYIYFQPTTTSTATLSSNSISINSDTVFRGNFYVESNGDSINFDVSFQIEGSTSSVQLGTIPDTALQFRIFDFDCSKADCCKGAGTCSGKILIKADVTTSPANTKDIFAVDAFEVYSACGLFPGNNDNATNFHGQKPLKFY